MKSLSLNRPLMLVVIGLPGAGKSFFARQFADTFGVARISNDRLRAELFAQPTFSREENDIISRLQTYLCSELAKTKRSFIIDGGCNARSERQKIEQLAKDNGYGTLTIWVQTDEYTAKLRSSKRSPQKTDDAHNVSLNPDEFSLLAKRLTPPQREQYVVISGKHVYSTQARMVLRKLASPHKEAADTVHTEQTQSLNKSAPRATAPQTRGIVIR